MVSVSSIVRTVAFFSALAASHAAAADDNSPQRTATIAREEARDWSVNATTREPVEQTLTAAGAAFMTVHFSEFNLAEGDVVTIRNSTGDVLDEYKGLGRGDLGKQGGFYSTVVYGDKVTVQFKPAADAKVESDSGFKIDKITRSTNQAKVSSICSADNTLPAKCYENAPNIPEAYKKAQAVARLIVNGAEACTGWLIGSEGHLLTNQHCIGTQSAASNLQVQFEAESPTCDDQCRASGSCKGVIAATTSTLVAVNADLDYALVKLDPLVDLSKYGYLKLRVAGAIENEEIYIPEHPGGKAKRMAVIVDSGEAARVHVDRSTECGEHRLEYDADTEGGASGSPIIAVSDNLVIGLHSCGNTQEVCMNSALDIRSLVHELRALNVVPADALDDPAAELPEGPWIPGATEAPAATTPAPVLDICPGFNFQNSCEEFTGGKCVWNDGSCSKNPAFTSVPAPETPAPETPAPETPAPETPAPETPAPETPAPETPAPETPAPETPAPETPALRLLPLRRQLLRHQSLRPKLQFKRPKLQPLRRILQLQLTRELLDQIDLKVSSGVPRTPRSDPELMFWRRNDKKAGATGRNDGVYNEDDDIQKLQRQFGIKTFSDKEVEADFLRLMGGAKGASSQGGLGLGLSPRSELALFGGGGHDDSDEEAKILRELNISGNLDSINVEDWSDDDDDEDDGAKVAKQELRSVLTDIHASAKEGHAARVNGTASSSLGKKVTHEEVHAMKLRAVELKRAGHIQEALAVFREVKVLEAQFQNAGAAASDPMTVTTRVETRTTSVRVKQAVEETHEAEEDDDVEVTDEDMQNPEYLAQLAMLGLSIDHPAPAKSQQPQETVDSLEQQIRETKERAVQFKRANQINEALAQMRLIKELEGKLAVVRQKTPPATQVPPPIQSSTTVHTKTVTSIHIPVVPGDVVEDPEVEVTDKDMNDPAFDEELKKLGLDPKAGSAAPDSTPLAVNQTAVAKMPRRYSSVNDDDLIDEFEDSDEENASFSADLAATTTSQEETTFTASVSTQEPPQAHNPTVPSDQEDIGFSRGLDVEELQAQLDRAKLAAVNFKREGNINAALDMMRRVKQIDNLITLKRQAQSQPGPVVTASPSPSPQELERQRKFAELEQLLVRFGDEATAKAREKLSINRAQAAEWLAKRKSYGAHMEKLQQMRRIPGQDPPPFHVESLSEQVKVEHLSIPEDEAHFRIVSVNGLQQVAGKDIMIKFNLSFPSSAPHEGKSGVVRISERPPFTTGEITSENAFRFRVQRTRGTQRLFEIKKAVFEVWRPGTLLRNPEFIARGYQELHPLLTVSQIQCHIPFVGSNRKPVGGDIEISLRIRTPLRDTEYQTVVTESLHVGEYPPLASSVAETPPLSVSTSQLPSPASSSSSVATAQSTPLPAPSPTHSTDDADLEDPHDLDMIISYDVINEEMEKIEAKLSSLSGPVAAELRDRFDSLALKKQLLEIGMQTGTLTLDMYTEQLQARIRDDRQIISRLLKANRRPDAARVLHRVKVMEKELEGTEEPAEQ
ncbi:hypothetical protein Poli38472_005956 [Pythium oligandrum]|uniref:Serine protease n=1 Tax=Pythium oligandrum TaxID=41045 RepID=A0A8K1FSF1_PYTOL|nr:hypothetical protein Poli38472_005956 [Pythium oligandrum]|eukprot:TMW68488.1 hypothetical protein Poli38472_005956 [Pythium oligandrum]